MKKNHAVIALAAITVVAGIFMLRSNDAEAPDVLPIANEETAVETAPTETTTKKAPPTKTTVTPPKPAEPAGVFENGMYVNIIRLTNNGFEPQAVSITPGESVRFVNMSGSAMRIRSAEYSGLNQEKSVGYGGIYELMFTKSGIWPFYNGTDKNVLGVVNVQ